MDHFMATIKFGAIWAALGPLVGVGVGQYLTHHFQKERWSADSKKKEYKELLGVLDSVFAFYTREGVLQKIEKAEHTEYIDKNLAALWCIRDRIFIADEIDETNVLERWTTMINEFLVLPDSIGFTLKYNELRAEILALAKKDIRP
jgi:hypothetical protein